MMALAVLMGIVGGILGLIGGVFTIECFARIFEAETLKGALWRLVVTIGFSSVTAGIVLGTYTGIMHII